METRKGKIDWSFTTPTESVAVVIVIVAVVLCGVMLKKSNRENPTATLGIYIVTSFGNPDNNRPGGITYSVWDRYGGKRVVLLDDGFDGTLDKVVVVTNEPKDLWIDSNSPDWDNWIEIYHQIRAEATAGKRL